MKLKINIESLADEFFEETHIMGIVASLKNYQFVWQLNETLGYTFKLNTELEIEVVRKSRKYFFSVYEYRIPSTTLTHYLYHNQNAGEYLLPEFRNLDFLWLIKGDEVNNAELSSLKQSLRDLPSVQFVDEMNHEKIKNKDHLIF
ncbi:MAG: hypothetical protein RL582_33 [Bacteroidota bacterium]|jgi:hypothetical protein